MSNLNVELIQHLKYGKASFDHGFDVIPMALFMSDGYQQTNTIMGTFMFILVGILLCLSILEMHHSRQRE